MADATPTRLGQANLTGLTDATFLKVYSGEVMTAFEIATEFMDRSVVRTISNGKSATFPITGRASAYYHTPGAELVGVAVGQNERTITVDDFLVSPNFIPEIDELRNHYDVRKIFSTEAGRALAYQFDAHVAAMGLLAARASTNLTGEPGGTALAVDGVRTNATTLSTQFFTAQQTMDQNNVPADDRWAFVRPAQYYLLVQSTTLQNRDWGGEDNMGYAKGKIAWVAGLPVIKTNALPSTNVNSGPAAYQGDFSKTSALIMNKSATGTLKLQDINVRISYDERRLGTLIVSKMAVGHGILRPACAVEVAYNSTP